MLIEWKDLPGHEDYYSISSDGHVYNKKKLKLTKLFVYGNGYVRTNLLLNGKYKSLLVHRLVATCFIANPLNLTDVNHKDYNKRNNNVSNLEWLSHINNLRHSCGPKNKAMSFMAALALKS